MSKTTITTIFLTLLISFQTLRADMFDPAIEQSDKEWCYGGKTTTVIGKPFVPRPVQITFDGAIFTGSAELLKPTIFY